MSSELLYRKYLFDLNKLLKQRKLLNLFAGLYKSKILGSGVEFDRLRRYVPGDPIRYIEWRAFARTRKLFLKSFKEYKRLKIAFIADTTLAARSSLKMFGYIVSMFHVMDLFAAVASGGKDLLGAYFNSNRMATEFIPLKSSSVFRELLRKKLIEIFKTPLKNVAYQVDAHWYCSIFQKIANSLARNSLVVVLNTSKVEYTDEYFQRVLKAFVQRYPLLWLNFYETPKTGKFQTPLLPVLSFSNSGLLLNTSWNLNTLSLKRLRYFQGFENYVKKRRVAVGTIDISRNILKQLIWILHS